MSQRRSQPQSQQRRFQPQSQQQGSQSQSQQLTQSQSQITDDAIQEAAVEVVTLLLDYQQFGRPIKRQFITKSVPKSQGRIFSRVMECVKQKLDDTFGYGLVEIGDRYNLRFIIFNKLTSTENEVNAAIANKSILKKNEKNLLFLTLFIIHKSGGRLKESTLLDFYKKVRIIENVEKPQVITPYFATIDILKFLRNDLVETLYLECDTMNDDGDNEIRWYSWGIRAEKEVDMNEMENHLQSV